MKIKRNMMIKNYKDKNPKISNTVFVADSADIIGDVKIGDYSSVWFNATLRGDQNKIKIGNKTSIQDNVVIHVDETNAVQIGDNVSVGHGAVLHEAGYVKCRRCCSCCRAVSRAKIHN